MFKYEIMMKKNIIRAALFAVFAFVAGYGVYTSQKETAMSDLAMANVDLQYLLSWQVMVYIHHRKKPQCLTWLWRMWKHWQEEEKLL